MSRPTATLPSAGLETYIGRQAIYDAQRRLTAYELLFRRGNRATADVSDGDRATAQVLLNTLTVFGLDRLVGASTALVNVTGDFIKGKYPLPDPDRVVLEVLEDIPVDDELLGAIAGLRRRGYRFALDDFVFQPALRPLVEMADIVKIDVLGVSDESLARHVEELRPHPVRLLAERIENQAQFEFCSGLGFELFQGYLFHRPEVLTGGKIPATRIGALRVLEELHRPQADFDELAPLIGQDLSITHKLLRLVNSAHYGLPRSVTSIRDALVMLGEDTIRRWVTVIALAESHETAAQLLETALTRARFCELLGSASPGDAGRGGSGAFLVGLFSTLDRFLGRPLESILAELPLAPPLVEALLHRRGPEGAVLEAVIDYERRAAGETAPAEAARPGLHPEAAEQYLEAAAWASEITRLITAASAG